MGFTQKASCRPYKNCYKAKGGASKKTLRKSIRRSKPISTRNSTPKVLIFQQSLTYSSNPNPGQPYGRIVRVSYENGKSKKMEINLNKAGKPVNIKQTPVKR